MGNEVVGLEDEPDAVVAECVPVAILVFLGRDAVDDKVARVVVVEPADEPSAWSRLSLRGAAPFAFGGAVVRFRAQGVSRAQFRSEARTV